MFQFLFPGIAAPSFKAWKFQTGKYLVFHKVICYHLVLVGGKFWSVLLVLKDTQACIASLTWILDASGGAIACNKKGLSFTWKKNLNKSLHFERNKYYYVTKPFPLKKINARAFYYLPLSYLPCIALALSFFTNKTHTMPRHPFYTSSKMIVRRL